MPVYGVLCTSWPTASISTTGRVSNDDGGRWMSRFLSICGSGRSVVVVVVLPFQLYTNVHPYHICFLCFYYVLLFYFICIDGYWVRDIARLERWFSVKVKWNRSLIWKHTTSTTFTFETDRPNKYMQTLDDDGVGYEERQCGKWTKCVPIFFSFSLLSSFFYKT